MRKRLEKNGNIVKGIKVTLLVIGTQDNDMILRGMCLEYMFRKVGIKVW